MPEQDGEEIQATMKSLALLLDQVVQGNRQATPSYMQWFRLRLEDLPPFASQETTKKLQKTIAAIKEAQKQLELKGAEEKFFVFAQKALILMNEILIR